MAHVLILPCPADSAMTNWNADQYKKTSGHVHESRGARVRDGCGTNDTYLHFLGVATEFQEKRIDAAEWMESVKELFDGHWLLLLRFSNFLPQDYGGRLRREEVLAYRRVEIVDASSKPVAYVHSLDRAQDLLDRIRGRFWDQEHVYNSFIQVVHSHKKGEKTREEVLPKVAAIFQIEHEDL